MGTEPEKNSLSINQQESFIHAVGRQLAKRLPKFFGKVQFNIQGGNYVNANTEQSFRPKKQENK